VKDRRNLEKVHQFQYDGNGVSGHATSCGRILGKLVYNSQTKGPRLRAGGLNSPVETLGHRAHAKGRFIAKRKPTASRLAMIPIVYHGNDECNRDFPNVVNFRF